MPLPSSDKATIVLRKIDRVRLRNLGRVIENAGVVEDGRKTFVIRVALAALEKMKPEEIAKLARTVERERPDG